MAHIKSESRTQVRMSGLSQSKVYEYIKKIEVEGYPRIRAYAEVIDDRIYDYTPSQIGSKLDYLRTHYPNYDALKEMVLAENKDWALRRSGALQNKALDLLGNLLDKANEIATKPDADMKELNVAVSTLKSVMPAFTAVNQKATMSTDTKDRKARASHFIN